MDGAALVDQRVSMHKLEVFRLTVELGGVGKAAARLYLTQPVVSAHIKSLQDRLGVRLFVKKGRNLELTEPGRAVCAWACDIARRTSELEDDLVKIGEGSAGTVTVFAAPAVGSYLIPGVVADFAAAHPDARVSLQIAQPDQVLDAVAAGGCDFGVLITDAVRHDSGVVGVVLGWEELVLVAAADSTLVGESIRPGGLAGIPFISTPDDMIMRRIEDATLTSIGVPRRSIVLEVGHPEATKRALQHDVGVALMFRCAVAPELERGELREVALRGPQLRAPVYLVRRESARLSPLQTGLIEVIAADLSTVGADPDAKGVSPEDP